MEQDKIFFDSGASQISVHIQNHKWFELAILKIKHPQENKNNDRYGRNFLENWAATKTFSFCGQVSAYI